MAQRWKLSLVTTLTLLRVPLVLLFFAGALVYSEYRHTWVFAIAFASLIGSAVTDLFDGWLARKFHVETKFGAHADPLMDKFFYLATFPLLVYVTAKNAVGAHSHPWAYHHALVVLILTLLFLSRDQWVTFLRSIGSIYDVSGKAHWSGKLRTGITFPLICVLYHVEESPVQIIPRWFLYGFEAVALAINFISVYVYTKKYWPYLRRSATPEPQNDR